LVDAGVDPTGFVVEEGRQLYVAFLFGHRRELACVKTMMVYKLFRVIVYTFIKQAGYLGS